MNKRRIIIYIFCILFVGSAVIKKSTGSPIGDYGMIFSGVAAISFLLAHKSFRKGLKDMLNYVSKDYGDDKD